MSSIVPSYSPRSGVDEIKAKLSDLSKDLDKFAPEHRSQVLVDRLKQQKLRAMIALAKAQQYLAETDVLIADYNLRAVADEFEHIKKERKYNNTDMRSPQNSGSKEEKLVSTTDFSSSNGNKDKKYVSSCTSLLPAVDLSKSKEKGGSHSKTDQSKSKVPETSSKTHEPTKSKTYKESSSKTKEAATSKTNEASSSKIKKAATSKTYEASSSKTKEAAISKTHEASSSKSKEPVTSKASEATTSTKEATCFADIDLPASGKKSNKRKRSKSKSRDSKRHKSSHTRAASSDAPAAPSNAPAAQSTTPVAPSTAPAESTHAPAASPNVNTLLGSAASSLVNTVFSRATATPSHAPTVSSHLHTLLSHVPNCDCPKYNRANKEKTLLNTSISPIKKIVEAKGIQTDKKTSKSDIVQTDEVKTEAKSVQTDHVIILHVESQTTAVNSPDIDDEETLLLDTSPAPHSHSTAISLAKALQEIKSQKTSVLKRLCPTAHDVSQVLSKNDVLQKIELIMEEEAETVEENPRVVKMEPLDREDIPNTSTEVLINNLYKDIMKAKDTEINQDMKPKEKVTRRGLWKILDKC